MKFILKILLGVLFLIAIIGNSKIENCMGAIELPAALQYKLDKNISLDLRDMDVVDVYKFLALRGGFNVTISKNISGRVTLYLKSVSIRDSLDIISLANNLAYSVVGENIIYVMTEEEHQASYGKRFGDQRIVKITKLQYVKPAYALEALANIKSEIGKVVIDEDTGSIVLVDTPDVIEKMEKLLSEIDVSFAVCVFDLQYATADDVATKLKEKLDSKSVGFTQADARSNQVIVSALPERMKEVEMMISALDKKTKAVLIDVKMLKVTLNPQFDMGVDWSQIVKTAHRLAISGTFGKYPIAPAVTEAGALGNFTIGELVGENPLTDNITFLKQIKSSEVLANPSIMVTNNQEARIHIGDRLAYVTTTKNFVGDREVTDEEVHFENIGIKFNVTPTINQDGFVKMKVVPEISVKTGDLITPQGSRIPLINATTVDTEIIVSNGHTIVIGGLRQEEIVDERKGMPFLMDIPFIGRAFSSTSKNKLRTEIIILMTPHIMTGEENFADQTKEKMLTPKPYKTY
jgi:type II secretory pathway component GspD/PulD (secretin)